LNILRIYSVSGHIPRFITNEHLSLNFRTAQHWLLQFWMLLCAQFTHIYVGHKTRLKHFWLSTNDKLEEETFALVMEQE
jgi:hypothetical protein